MKSNKKIILAILLLTAVLTFLSFLSCGNDDENKAADGDWKAALENLLTQFPSVFKEIHDVSEATDAEGINVPYKFIFYDLDGDGIPEAMVLYGPPASERTYDKIYKFYGGSYEQIEHKQTIFGVYTNTDGKLVAESRGGYMVDAVYFAEINDKKLILSDFIDSSGSDTYNGVRYADLPELYETMDVWSAADLDDTLEPLPQLEFPDIVNAAKNRVNADNN